MRATRLKSKPLANSTSIERRQKKRRRDPTDGLHDVGRVPPEPVRLASPVRRGCMPSQPSAGRLMIPGWAIRRSSLAGASGGQHDRPWLHASPVASRNARTFAWLVAPKSRALILMDKRAALEKRSSWTLRRRNRSRWHPVRRASNRLVYRINLAETPESLAASPMRIFAFPCLA